MRSAIVLAVVAVITGCGGGGGPAGPDEIMQVFARERVMTTDADGKPVVALEPRLAFGDHPDIDHAIDDRQVTAAVARDGQKIRIVVDRLLRGNQLEEVACADGSWSRVPDGATFDDVARCAGADLSACDGICIGAHGPVGILDQNHDGAIDDTRLIEGAVILTCGGVAVPLDRQRSFYAPSGDQLISAGSIGVDSLGPAVVIAPADGMPPGSQCKISFAPTVVDKAGDEPCAPSAAGCAPGDTSAIRFGVEPFLVAGSLPADGAADVALTDQGSPDAIITIQLNAALDDATIATAVTLTADGAPVIGLSPAIADGDDAAVAITVAGGFTAGVTYALTVAGGGAGVKDRYADALSADATITWTAKGP